jgi:hypothetical protein
VLILERAIGQRNSFTWEKDTKDHQQRRIALDPETLTLLAAHRQTCQEHAAAVGLALTEDAFVFSRAPDGSKHLLPDSVSQRYSKMAKTLGIKTTLHKLRHYSATELIAAGVDIRTVAGRLGHGGGGTTTLKVYTAWVSEQDQRAARNLFSRMPERTPPPKPVPTAPYEIIADDLRKQIVNGSLPIGAFVPTNEELAQAQCVGRYCPSRGVSAQASRADQCQPRPSGDRDRVTATRTRSARPGDGPA